MHVDWKAFRRARLARDVRFDGRFFVGILSTKIYCRPECSPGTPAWLGTPSTVSRALRLIAESGLEDGGVEGLAERLEVGERHLRRCFVKHLGATPSMVAQTRRLQFAKKLIDETALPMSQIAIASRFGCVRRFNATLFKTYQRNPTQIRRLARVAD